MEKKFYDFLGNELFDGDEVITIKDNGQEVGVDLVKVKIKIEDGKLKYDVPNKYEFCMHNIGSKCYKVIG